MKSARFLCPFLVLALPIFVVACGQDATVQEITETRTADHTAPIPAGLTSAQRFGVRMAANPAPSESQLPFTWDVPQGWIEAPANSMRLVNLVPAGDNRAECYLTVLPGGGGGIAANVNRWRKQMSLEPYSPEELTSLPKRPLLGQEAIYVEFEGMYKGMRGDRNEPGYKLAGLILPLNDQGLFVKLLGPKDVVDREMAHFTDFCSSLTIRRSAAAPPPAMSGSGGGNSSDGLGLHWTAPDGWKQGPDRPMRAVTFTMGANDATECYVSVLAGDGGGLVSNINRWARQIGAEPLTEAAVADLPVVDVLGAKAPVVEFTGAFNDTMSGNHVDDATLLGVVAQHAGHAIFIKLVGPSNDVARQKAQFLAFCQSIEH